MPLRVISGSAGGLLLKSPKRHALRPTQDRIRGAIFSSLAESVPGAHVLDLYAGTGSLGIEALSRGAARAVFVEQDREATECIRENLRHCRLEGGEVRAGDALAFLGEADGETFDLIFADPPYDKTRGVLNEHPLLARIAPRLRSKGVIVWEHFAEQQMAESGDWQILRHRTYGETGLTFLRSTGKNNG
jgi:16S rRNA (guanine966-N2)-methyltransferase